jgi:LPS sulfotransferase NodH
VASQPELNLELGASSVSRESFSAEIDSLVNLGIVDAAVNKFVPHAVRGVLICGLPRSGTTAFARALEAMGFSLGNATESPVAEIAELHPPLRAAVSGDSDKQLLLLQALENQISKLMTATGRYAIKLPDYYRFLNKLPVPKGIDLVLFITRDPICIAVRNSKSVCMERAAAIRKAVREYAELIDIASAYAAPSLLVSYEKLLATPTDQLSALAEIMGVNLSEDDVKAAASSVVINDLQYLKSSSLQRGELQGEVSYYAHGCIGGWCFWSGIPAKKVSLQVYTEAGEFIGEGSTRRIRTELVDSGLHLTGEVGFRVDLLRLVPLHQLRFKVDGQPVSLMPTSKLKQRLRRIEML